MWPYLLSTAAICKSSLEFVETNIRTPSERKISSFKSFILSSEHEFHNLEALAIVFATSNAKMQTLFPRFVPPPERNPLPWFKFVMLLPRVSNTSTAFSRPAMLALPSSVPVSGTWHNLIVYATVRA
jgi:hypothetical protein